MCAFDAALDFGKDMIELGASTLGKLVAIQFADLTTFLEHQNDAMRRLTEVRDISALTALERGYRQGFWHDRRAALAATGEALQIASRAAAESWAELVKERPSPPAVEAAKPVTKPAAKKVKSKAVAVERHTSVAAVTPAPKKRNRKVRKPPEVRPPKRPTTNFEP